MKPSPVLITGLSGFVGGHCVDRFAASDLTLDTTPVDLRRPADVCAAVAALRPAAVIHLAAQSFVPDAFRDPRETYDVNFAGTLNLLIALRDAGFQGRMLFVGSGDVYGLVPESELPVTEDRPARPRNPYAVSKVAAEALCYQWSQTGPFEIMLARPFNHIGPRQSPRFAVADFASQIARIRDGHARPVLSVGDIDATRDFTDVRDIVEAYRLLLERGRNGEVYNVCSGRERSLRSVIDDLCKIAGVEVTLDVQSQRLRPSEQRRMCGSARRLAEHTGWAPQRPWLSTLADILASFTPNKDPA